MLMTIKSLYIFLFRWNKQGINRKFFIGNRFCVTQRIVSPYIYKLC